MDINCLRVYNGMFKLGLTEEEFTRIESYIGKYQAGLTNVAYKKGRVIYIDNEDKGSIKIFTSPKVTIPSVVLCKTLITFEPIPQEVFLLHKMIRYHANDRKFRYQASNLEELKDRLITRFTDRSDKELELDKGDDTLKAVYWLFDQEFVMPTYPARPGIDTILKVFTKNNKRLAIIRHCFEHYEGGCWTGYAYSHGDRVVSEELWVITYLVKDPEYNYVDEGRESDGDLWLSDELNGKLSAAELRVISDMKDRNSGFILLTPKMYGELQSQVRMKMLAAKKESEDKVLVATLQTRAEQEFKKGKTIRNGVIYAHKYIEHRSMKVECSKIKDFVISNKILVSELTFDVVVHNFIDYTTSDFTLVRNHNRYDGDKVSKTTKVGTTLMKFNGVSVKVTGTVALAYVNDKKIRKDELHYVIASAMDYDAQEEYDAWLEKISKLSLRFVKLLSEGLNFKVIFTHSTYRSGSEDNDLIKNTSAPFCVSLKVIREENTNYLVYKDKKLKIKDLDSLFELKRSISSQYGTYRVDPAQRVIRLLFRSVKDITAKDIMEILEEGLKTQDQRVKNSKEFIRLAVERTKAVEKKGGWVIKGESGKEYFIGDNLMDGNKIPVYAWENDKKGNYICIEDVNDYDYDEATVNDKIAKRLIALSKDKTISSEVFTVADYIKEGENV